VVLHEQGAGCCCRVGKYGREGRSPARRRKRERREDSKEHFTLVDSRRTARACDGKKKIFMRGKKGRSRDRRRPDGEGEKKEEPEERCFRSVRANPAKAISGDRGEKASWSCGRREAISSGIEGKERLGEKKGRRGSMSRTAADYTQRTTRRTESLDQGKEGVGAV